MIKQLAEWVSTHTKFSTIFEEEPQVNKNEDIAYKIMFLGPKMTVPAVSELDPIIEYWQSLSPYNYVMINERIVPHLFCTRSSKSVFLDRITKLWYDNPDLRFMQLIGNVFHNDPYHVEDEDVISTMEAFYKR